VRTLHFLYRFTFLFMAQRFVPICSSNVVIDPKTMVPLLMGFAEARHANVLSIAAAQEDVVAKLTWDAPERLGVGIAEFSAKCDIYSLGILLLEIAIWEPLTKTRLKIGNLEDVKVENDRIQLMELDKIQAVKEALAKRLSKDIMEEYGDLVQKCISRAARDRPDSGEVLLILDQIEGTLETDESVWAQPDNDTFFSNVVR